jgi:FAD/FMN-containing dehydrogenase
MSAMRRRDFLRLAGGTAVGAAALGACGSNAHSSGSTTPGTSTSPSTTSRTPTTTPAVPTAAEWQTFGSSLQGELVLPSSPSYATDVQSYNPVFNGAHPEGIAYCASSGDVAKAVAFGRRFEVPLSIRSGGHCYGGWSTGTGLVIDVTPMNQVSVDTASGRVTAGSGTRLVDFYGALAPHGVAVPGGSCPTVGLAGLTMGGGLGVLGRKFGLTCDNLVAAEVVLASGEVITCNSTQHSDLYWALRGGGGGSFGVVTSFTFTTHPIGELGLFTLVWPWAAAPEVVAAWQSWAPHAPDELWSNCLLLASQQTPSGHAAVARVTGVYVGPQSELQTLVNQLTGAVPGAPFTNFVGQSGYLDTMLIEAGCDGDTVAQCHLPTANPSGILTRAPFAATSDIMQSPLSSAGITALLAVVEQRQTSPVLSGGGVELDASGGAINRVPANATAYVHRSALATVQFSANWNDGDRTSVVDANQAWLQAAWTSTRPYLSGNAYVNYPNADLPDWQQAYYGANFPRLQQVKAVYDPGNVFHFAQSIPLR